MENHLDGNEQNIKSSIQPALKTNTRAPLFRLKSAKIRTHDICLTNHYSKVTSVLMLVDIGDTGVASRVTEHISRPHII